MHAHDDLLVKVAVLDPCPCNLRCMATVDRAPRKIPTAGLAGVMQAAQWRFDIRLGAQKHQPAHKVML